MKEERRSFALAITLLVLGLGLSATVTRCAEPPAHPIPAPVVVKLNAWPFFAVVPPSRVSSSGLLVDDSGAVIAVTAALAGQTQVGKAGVAVDGQSRLVLSPLSAGLGGGTVTSVTGVPPIYSTGGATPSISCAFATAFVPGCLSVVDYNAFTTKQDALSTAPATSHQFLTGFTSPNTFTSAQPDYSDLSGSPTAGGSESQVQVNHLGLLTGYESFKFLDSTIVTPPGGSPISGALLTVGAQHDAYTVTSIPFAPLTMDGGALTAHCDSGSMVDQDSNFLVNGCDDSYFEAELDPIPFEFHLYGNLESDYGPGTTEVWITTNGYLQLGNPPPNESCYASDLDTTGGGGCTSRQIAPWMTDLNFTLGGSIEYELLGTAPNRVLVVKWDNVPLCCGALRALNVNTFQAELYEGTDIIKMFVFTGDETTDVTFAQGIDDDNSDNAQCFSGRCVQSSDGVSVITNDGVQFVDPANTTGTAKMDNLIAANIYGTLTGNVTGHVTGSADTASFASSASFASTANNSSAPTESITDAHLIDMSGGGFHDSTIATSSAANVIANAVVTNPSADQAIAGTHLLKIDGGGLHVGSNVALCSADSRFCAIATSTETVDRSPGIESDLQLGGNHPAGFRALSENFELDDASSAHSLGAGTGRTVDCGGNASGGNIAVNSYACDVVHMQPENTFGVDVESYQALWKNTRVLDTNTVRAAYRVQEENTGPGPEFGSRVNDYAFLNDTNAPIRSVGGFQDAAHNSIVPLRGNTAAIGGSLLAPGTCLTGTATITGATAGMVATATPQFDPGDGVEPPLAYISAPDTVTVKVCAAISVTPNSTIYFVRVTP